MPILHWLDRDKHVRAADAVPYRLLEADDEHSAGNAETSNMLIQGDNLEALKALLPYYAGRVKCIFIDPPYNTRSAFEHYDDNLEHSQWLAMIFPRLELLRELLSEDGSLWVTIDDNEGHYLKVIMDEVFGRRNFITNVVWQKSYTSNQTAKFISDTHDHILLYAKDRNRFHLGKVDRTEEQRKKFKNPDQDPRGSWKAENLSAGKFYDAGQFKIIGPTRKSFLPPKNRYWRCSEETFNQWLNEGRITFGKKDDKRPMLKKYFREIKFGLTPNTWWTYNEVGGNKQASSDLKALFPNEEVFGTPKPESLIERILTLSSAPTDLVLDSFLGSGTTAAVAHKMGRCYIGIEMGDHAVTHCVPRLRKVIEGEQGGISEAVGWKGGGGFRFYRLGAPVFDTEGRINPEICFAHLAAHIWFSETHTALHKKARTPLLGQHAGTAFYLLYNGILGDKRPDGGNVLTAKVLAALPAHDGQKVIYGEACRIGAARLKDLGIVFKQTPYDLKTR